MSPPDSALANLQLTIDELERQFAGQRAERDVVLARETATAELHQIINSGNRMRRRELFGVVAGAVILLPGASPAQHLDHVSHVGVLMGFSENRPETQEYVAAFAKALEGYGWLEGKNLRTDYRFFSATDPTLFDRNAAELIAMSPEVILASTTPALRPLHQQTRTIPVVFVQVSDPVGQGFVENLARPGGNITGFSAYDGELAAKWAQLLKEVAPGVTRVTVIFNPDTAPHARLLNPAIATAAPSLGMTATFAPVHDDAGVESAMAAVAREPGGGMIALPDSFNALHRDAIVAAAARHHLPLLGVDEFFARAGAVMSYSVDLVQVHAHATSYIDRILRGTKPADLPVQRPTKYSLIINLKTAEALGLTVPPALLALADDVIE
ncbi:MAG: ABC transporter substrate-binding protein [Alphaproteobacteria bacterium]|nr:ABC transporter substrate-binding protein [Alphaproteobacteria bacterium]